MKMFAWRDAGEVLRRVTCADGIHVREHVEFTLSVAADESVEITLCIGDGDSTYPFDEQPMARHLLSGLALDLASFFQDDVENVADATDYLLEQLLAQEGSLEVKWHYESGDRVEPAGVEVHFIYEHLNVKYRDRVTIDLEQAEDFFLLDHEEAG
jgi:hypothetical protein